MKDHLRWQAAVAEAENALAMLAGQPPADPVARRRQMAQAAKRLNKSSRILVDFDGLLLESA